MIKVRKATLSVIDEFIFELRFATQLFWTFSAANMKGYCLWLALFLIIPICFEQVGSNRPGENNCPWGEIPCDDTQCIPREEWCDGENHCRDRSDEQYCQFSRWYNSSPNDCKEIHFECNDGPCVPASTKCDGFQNCKDNSDETDCDKMEDKGSSFEETSASPSLKSFSSESSDNDNTYGSDDLTTSPIGSGETSFYPSHVPSIISTPRSSEDDYYKTYRGSTNDHTTNFDNNRAQPASPQITYNHHSGHSHSYDSSRVGQYPETSVYNPNQYSSQENIRSSYPIGASVRYPVQESSTTVGPCGSERNCPLKNSSGIFVRLPSRKFPRRFQPSISDTPDISSQHGSDRYFTSGNSNEASIRPRTHEYLSTVQPHVSEAHDEKSQYGGNGNFRSGNPNGIFVKLPSRKFPRRFQPSNSDTRDISSQHGSGRYFTPEHSNGASMRPPTQEYLSTVRPSVSEAHDEKRQYGGNENFRLGNPNGIFVKLPSRKFPRTRYQGRTQTISTVSPPDYYTFAQHADYGGSKYGIQSDSGQSENYIYEPFHFKTNYRRKFGRSYEDNVKKATKWILDQRNAYGWGENTSRALIALSLINNSFPFSFPENELMKKSLATHFGIQMLLLCEKPDILNDGELATYINALLATCQNPKDFFNNDVMVQLRAKTNIFLRDVNPFAYLTLCLTNTPIEYNELAELTKVLSNPDQDERTSDMKILATTALACFQRQDQYKKHLESTVKGAYQNLLYRRLTDYSFGSIYTTALAAQALMSIDTDEWHDAKKTVDFLIESQSRDGSFGDGDMLATYLILPVLSGRSLLHLRNTHCDPVKPAVPPTSTSICDSEEEGPKTGIYYTIKVGYPDLVSSNFIYLEIPKGKNFSYAMVKAECLNSKFRFLYKKLDNGNVDVHTIVDIPNDTELGFRWKLYVVNEDQGQEVTLNLREWYNEDITELIPQDNQEFIYWYLPIFL